MTVPLKFQLIIPVPDSLNAPFAALAAQCDEECIRSLDYLTEKDFEKATMLGPQTKWMSDLAIQLHIYFQDPNRARFSDMLPRLCDESVLPIGAPEKRRKMREMVCAISCGEILAYSEIAPQAGLAFQNVGTACGLNRIGIIVPCFRVVACPNNVYCLGEYSKGNPHVDEKTGLAIKRWLIEHEGKWKVKAASDNSDLTPESELYRV